MLFFIRGVSQVAKRKYLISKKKFANLSTIGQYLCVKIHYKKRLGDTDTQDKLSILFAFKLIKPQKSARQL